MGHIKLKAEIKSIPLLLDFINLQCRKNLLSSEDCFSIMLIGEELATNICYYAYPDTDGDFELNIEFFPELCSIEIIDSGIPFDPTRLQMPDVDSPLAERKIGGMGILLVKESSDDFQYKRSEGKNIVKVTKILKSRIAPLM